MHISLMKYEVYAVLTPATEKVFTLCIIVFEKIKNMFGSTDELQWAASMAQQSEKKAPPTETYIASTENQEEQIKLH